MTLHHPTFSHILYPLPPTSFFEQFWENNFVHIQGRHPSHYSSILPEYEEFMSILDSPTTRKKYSMSTHSTYHLSSDSFINESFSIIVNNIQQQSNVLQNLVHTLENSFHIQIRTNLYKTPPYYQALPVHFDWMDVFILQINGSKQWNIYNPLIPQPRPQMLFPIKNSSILQHIANVTLQPGDLMYIPSGVIHQAHALQDGSTHLTINIETTAFGSWESVLVDVFSSFLKKPQQYTGQFTCHLQYGKIDLLDILQEPVNKHIVWANVVMFHIIHVGTHHPALRRSVSLYSSSSTNDLETIFGKINTNVDLGRAYKYNQSNLFIFDRELKYHMIQLYDMISLTDFNKHLSNRLQIISCCILSNKKQFINKLSRSLHKRKL